MRLMTNQQTDGDTTGSPQIFSGVGTLTVEGTAVGSEVVSILFKDASATDWKVACQLSPGRFSEGVNAQIEGANMQIAAQLSGAKTLDDGRQTNLSVDFG